MSAAMSSSRLVVGKLVMSSSGPVSYEVHNNEVARFMFHVASRQVP
jgi:hypothetical protein